MKRSISGLLCFLSLFLLFSSCRKKAFDDFYGAPNLAPPIYDQLTGKAEFSNLVKVIDKTPYKQTLSAAGSWTFFAPNNTAFSQFLQEQGLASVDDITPELAEKIVRYSMIYDGEKSDRLSDFFSNKGFVENQGFRRRTLYYDFVYDTKNNLDGADIKAVPTNRGIAANGLFVVYNQAEFNNKHIPIFLESFKNQQQLSASDYEYFYPGSTYTGFNVGPASVSATERDLEAENGIIHVVDKVLVPVPNFEQYLKQNSQYSSFYNLLERFAVYNKDDALTRRYNVLTGKSDPVYIKYYNSLPFAPNNENYVKLDANDAQQNSFSMVAPTNAALNDYAKKVLMKYYPNTTLEDFATLRGDVILSFINSHMVPTVMWPSRFNTTTNQQTELFNVTPANVVDKKLLSNGFFYGVNDAQKANIFETVYGKIYLDPKFSFFRAAIDRYGYGDRIRQKSSKYAIIPVSDALLNKMGFTYDAATFPTAPVRYNGNADDVRLRRIIGKHVIDLNARGAIPTVSDYNTGRGFLLTAGNEPDNYEYIRYDTKRLYSSGTIDSAYTPLPPALNGLTDNTNKSFVRIDSTAIGINGTVLYADGLLSYTDNAVGLSIQRNGTTATQPYFKFYQYLLNNAAMYNTGTRVITGVDAGLPYTVFIPTNAAIDAAVAAGVLPASNNPTVEADRVKVTNFLKYHILNKATIVADGHLFRQGVRETLLINGGSAVQLNISQNTPTTLQATDGFGRVANVISPQTSLLANRTVIHLIDNYLKP